MRNFIFELRSRLPFAVAGFARLFQNPPRAFAMRARLRDAENAARHQAPARARRTSRTFSILNRLRAGAVARFAFVELGDGNFLFAAERGFFERDFQIVTQIITALRSGRILAAAEKIFKNAAHRRAAEDFAENVERIVESCPRRRNRRDRARAGAGRTRRGRIGRRRRVFAGRSKPRRPR
jgi:hypothetical protein